MKFTIGGGAAGSTIQVGDASKPQTTPIKVDTGAAVSILYEEVMRAIFLKAKLQPVTLPLKTYTGNVTVVVS